MKQPKNTPPNSRSVGASHELRNRAEALLSKNGKQVDTVPWEDIKALVHELQVHQVELEFQNVELREAESKLSESRDHYSDLYDFSPVGYLTFDADTTIIEANLTAARLLGTNRGKLTGRKFSDFVDRDEQDVLFIFRRKVFASEKLRSCELLIRSADGTMRNVRLRSAATVTAASGKVSCRIALIDATGEKEAEEEARKKHQFSESLIEAAQSIFLVLDCDGRIIRYNKVLEQISGRSLEDFEGCDWFDTFLPAEDHGQVRELFRSVALVSPTSTNINPIVTESGILRDIEWQSAPLRDADGGVIGIVCSGTDVTDRLLLEQEVFRASEEEKIRIAQDLHDGLGSHLTGISFLFAAMAKDLRHGTAVEAKAIERVADSLTEAIDQTRTLAHGMQGISDQPNALPGALKSLIAWVRSSSNLECRFTASSDPIVITNTAIANHVFRIAQEAVNNAIRHSGAKLLTLRIETTTDGNFSLTVLDNGSGFDPVELPDRGIGLRTMEYRAHAIGARLRIKRRKKGGTRVKCVFSDQLALEK